MLCRLSLAAVLIVAVLTGAVFGQGAAFLAGPNQPSARTGHRSATLTDGRVVLFGGHGSGFTSLSTAAVWNPSGNSFTSAQMTYTHDMPTFARLADGRYLLAGGSQDLGVPGYTLSELYDSSANTFTATGNMARNRSGGGAGTLTSGKVLIAGGWWSHNDSHTYGELYDPTSGTFIATGALNSPRAYPVVLPTSDGKAIVAGGITYNGSAAVEQIELYDPATNSFSVVRNTLFVDAESGWSVNGGSYSGPIDAQQMGNGDYLLLAYKSTGEQTLLTFDPDTKQFTKIAVTPALPDTASAALWPPVVDASRGRAYLFAALPNANPTQARVYTVETSTWTRNNPTGSYTFSANYYLTGAAVTLLKDGRIFLTGGSSTADSQANYNPIPYTMFISAAPICVNKNASGSVHNGVSWATAYLSVQEALDAAVAGQAIWVARGTYDERITIKPEVALYGGFDGTEIWRDARNWRNNPTILDGGRGGSVVTFQGGATSATRIDGFTVRNGYVNGNGGGIRCEGASPVIANCLLSGSGATNVGGGLYITSSTSSIVNCKFKANYASQGGGMYCGSSSPQLANNIFLANSASSNGGAISLASSTPTITNNSIIANNSPVGGGIACYNSSPNLSNNIIAYCSSGVYHAGSGAETLRHNCVYGNTAYNYAGTGDVTGFLGNIGNDPRLVGLNYGNVHLMPDSPCVNTGENGPVQAGWVDMDGQPRIQPDGGTVDMGADESDGTMVAVAPQVVRVGPDGNDANDGSSWDLPKRSIQVAISTAAVGGGDVWVKSGVYHERINLLTAVEVLGGFAGTESTRDERSPRVNETVLDGDQQGDVVTALNLGSISGIDGFTIRNGFHGIFCSSASPRIANNRITGNSAGGIYCVSSLPIITGNVIEGNTGSGGIYCNLSSPAISANEIEDNRSTSHGGGIYCTNGSNPSISGNEIMGNGAGSNYQGGGIRVDGGSQPTVTNNHISDNTATNGGGISAEGGTFSVTGNTISGNTATNIGGGFHGAGTSVTVSGNRCLSNTAVNGGGMYFSDSSALVSNNMIVSNSSTNLGGGIDCYRSASTVIASNVILGNSSAAYGGGVCYEGGSHAAITNNTIIGNDSQNGGGIACLTSNVTAVNNIVAFGNSGIYRHPDCNPTFRNNCVYENTVYAYYGLIDPTGTDGNIAADPLMAAAEFGEVHLLTGSPCIGAGDGSAVQQTWKDMDGQARIQPESGAVDIGADESDGTDPTFTPNIVRVSTTGSDQNDGSSWELAKKTVQAAIDAVAEHGGEVWVKAGLYKERITLKQPVYVYGGFAGHESSKDERDFHSNETILDGEQKGDVVSALNFGSGACIDGFTIKNGARGVCCSVASPAILNNKITGNRSGGIHCANSGAVIAGNNITGNIGSGGLYLTASTANVSENTISKNTSTTHGGGIYCTNASSLVITGNTISDNSAPTGQGGGIRSDGGSSPVISGNTFSGNRATHGGGVSCEGGTPIVSGNKIVRNTATPNNGGGIYLNGVSENSVISENDIRGNNAGHGGGMYVHQASPTISNNKFITNSTTGHGGGLYVYRYGAPKVRNNTFVGNSADNYGGGCFVDYNVNGQIVNNTFVGNNAPTGGGLAFWSSSNPTVANNIVAFNSSGMTKTPECNPTLKSNCVYENTAYDFSGMTDPTGTDGNISDDPMLVSWEYGNVHVQPGSPCIDAGDIAAAQSDWTDMDGEPRVQPEAGAVDIGADESDGTWHDFYPNIIAVSAEDGDDENDGSSWESAKLTIQAGIDAAAEEGGQVWVAAGEYRENVTLKPFVYLYGGFSGWEEDPDERDEDSGESIIDGGQQGDAVTAANLGCVAGIDNFTVKNGQKGIFCSSSSPVIAGNNITGNSAGGIYCVSSSPIIKDNEISGNLGNGGIYCNFSLPAIVENLISTNTTATHGAGIYCTNNASPAITGNTITRNNAPSGQGGGIRCESGSNAIISENNLTENYTASHGGAISCEGCSPVITSNAIERNRAPGGWAGGICLNGANATISGNKLTENSAATGGAIFLYSSSPAISNNKIGLNSATSEGGGVRIYRYSSPTFSNNLVVGNSSASSGGGMYVDYGSSPTVVNNTIVANTAPVGGGLSLYGGSPVIVNNIIAFGGSGIFRNSDSSPTFKNNCVYGNSAYAFSGIEDQIGTNGNIATDPMLASLEYGDLHIMPGSPCIGVGDNTAVQAEWTDMDDQPRIQPDGEMVDIGADESDGGAPSVAPTIVRVSEFGDDENDGSTWWSAKLTIQAAIDAAAEEGGEVWVASGFYQERVTLAPFVHVYGGFGGGEEERDERNWTFNETIIDAGQQGDTVTAQNFSAPATIDGFVIENASGRGVYCASSAPAIRNNLITGNAGSGVCCTSSTPEVVNNWIAGNLGGGIYLNASSAMVAHNWITVNSAVTHGGGIYCTGASSPSVLNNEISWNYSPSHGGGIRSEGGSSPIITDNIIRGNTTGNGGAISCEGGSPLVSGNEMMDNIATGAGGGMYLNGVSGSIRGNDIVLNTAPAGGGIYFYSSSPDVANNMIAANNSTSSGGGLYIYRYSSPSVRNNTIIGNSATTNGGGIEIEYASNPAVVNNTVASNASVTGGGIAVYNSSPTIVNNIVAFGSSGIFRNSDASPTFRNNCVYGNQNYAYTGIEDQTGTNGNIADDPKLSSIKLVDAHIQPDSPCVGAGDGSVVQAGWTDMDGQPRVQPEGESVDIGADESDGGTSVPEYIVIRVSPDGNDDNDGSTWELAKRTIQSAIDMDEAPAEVWVRDGTYEERITLSPYVNLYGGFAGTENARDERDPESHETIIDGQFKGDVITARNMGIAAVVDGFTIRNANGSGVYCHSASPVISNNKITANMNGGVYCGYSSPQIRGNEITENTGRGGIYCTLSSSPRIEDNTIAANNSTYGGGIFCDQGSAPFVVANEIKTNSATHGGGIYCHGASPTIGGNRIEGNTVTVHGAGIYCYSSSPAIVSNLLIDNNAVSNGGAIYCYYYSAPSIVNNTLARNSASEDGGGIALYRSSPAISNNIVAFGGKGIFKSADSTPVFKNNCVYENTDYDYSGLTDPNGTDGNISVDPGFTNLADGDCHLEGGSLCIDAGDDASVQPDWRDMDGELRSFGSHVDIGADEWVLRVGAPVFTPEFDLLASSLNVSITCPTEGAIIYYTTNGDDPTEADWLASGPVMISGTTLLKARAFRDTWMPSAVKAWLYTKVDGISLADLKEKANSETVACLGAIVTAVFDDFFYVESENRTTGIRIYKPSHGLSVDTIVDVAGIIKTNADGERFIDAHSIIPRGSASVRPVGMTNKALGGGDWNYKPTTGEGQKGVLGGVGLNNIGLLVTTTGLVGDTSAGSFYIDDGSGVGIKVVLPLGIDAPDPGSHAIVTGICCCEKSVSDLRPVICMRGKGDITAIPGR